MRLLPRPLPLLALAAALTATAAAQAATDHAHWEYTGHAGAAHWGELDKSFETCKLGTHQSPSSSTCLGLTVNTGPSKAPSSIFSSTRCPRAPARLDAPTIATLRGCSSLSRFRMVIGAPFRW